MSGKTITDLWATYSKRLYVYLGTLVGNSHEIREDLVQTAFLKAHTGLADLDRGRDPGPWLFRIARNAAIDYLRARGREWDKNRLFTAIEGGAAPSAETVASLALEGDALRQALVDLPGEEQELLYLRFYEEMSYGDIAQLTGIPEGTVKWKVHGAKNSLREKLEVIHGFGS